MRRLVRFLIPAGVLITAVLLIRRTVRLRDEALNVVPSRDPWTPIAEAPVEPVVAHSVDPIDGTCPATHPIKAKAASGIYHMPGMANYQRTRPDRCYAEESAAEADGFTKSKR
jgi:hypothetical protein